MTSARKWRGKRLVLAVIDGLKPEMLERAVQSGSAPALAALMERGVYIDACVAAFPSVTPVCTATITTGVGPDRHGIPGMNWYHRGERRYVEYGSSFPATRAFGIGRSLTDTVYNLNLAHLSREVATVFELLDDAELRTAGTTFLIYRGRHRQEAATESALGRLATATLFRHAVYGPRELFYADLFATRRTGCRSQLGLPGARDAHAGCVGAYLVEHDLFDFLLLSLPDNDTTSHRHGPEGQIDSIALANREIERVMAAAGGLDEFLERYAMIVLGDHSHSRVEQHVSLRDAFGEWKLLEADGARGGEQIALCPGQRSAMVYALDDEELVERIARAAGEIEGVDLVLRRDGDFAYVGSARGELRFKPGGKLSDLGGRHWAVSGELDALAAQVDGDTIASENYPDALARVWSALGCVNSGDVLISATPGYEFIDWGGADHVGGGSHGALHRGDSIAALVCCGVGPASADERAQWTLQDVLPMVRAHFGV